MSSEAVPNFRQSVRLRYVKLGWHYAISNLMYVVFVPVLFATAAHLSTYTTTDLDGLLLSLRSNATSVVACSSLLVFLATVYVTRRPRPVYLLDYSCYKPEDVRKCTRETFVEKSTLAEIFNKENLLFQKKILERSGLGQDTYFPEALMRTPPNPCMAEARKEAETVMFGAVDDLLAKTGVNPKDIGVLIVNCSLFNPTPSLSAMLVNHYKLRGNIHSYNLGGMGCSAGLISIDLAKKLLQLTSIGSCEGGMNEDACPTHVPCVYGRHHKRKTEMERVGWTRRGDLGDLLVCVC